VGFVSFVVQPIRGKCGRSGRLRKTGPIRAIQPGRGNFDCFGRSDGYRTWGCLWREELPQGEVNRSRFGLGDLDGDSIGATGDLVMLTHIE